MPVTLTAPKSIFIGAIVVFNSIILEALAIYLGCRLEDGSICFNFSTDNTYIQIPNIIMCLLIKFFKDLFFYRSLTFYTFMSEMSKLATSKFDCGQLNSYDGSVELPNLCHAASMHALSMSRFDKNRL